ncbi:3'-5'-exoribonuclease [Maublancomyces gigas]|uniref:3'-5'-exoribonuclease n=1 Tax=Discina gigas TaxID=1032678 RepID=A0ABR3GT28_9PEZI
MTDRRRINGPSEGTTPPVFASAVVTKPTPTRAPDSLRKIFLKTSLTPPATGSAFLELPSPAPYPNSSTLKITASVYGPRPLPSSAAFSPHARLTAELKFAPFSTPHKRRGYVRDAVERDLSVQLQNALVKSIKTGAYPKSGIDVFITVLDCEGGLDGDDDEGVEVGLMGVLAGAITCASAAVADAGIECVDLVSGGVAALVKRPQNSDAMDTDGMNAPMLVLDPSPADGYQILSAAVVGYMAGREEVTLLWTKGSVGILDGEEDELDLLMDGAIMTATAVRLVLNEAVKERMLLGLARSKGKLKEDGGGDVAMSS